MDKKIINQILIFFLFSIFMIITVSACGPGDWGSCDYYIDSLDAVCLNDDNDTYVLNWSYFNWSIYNDIGYQRSPSNSTHRIHFQYQPTPQNDYAYVDADYIYQTIPYYDDWPVYTTYAEVTVISHTTNSSQYPDEMGRLRLQRKTDESELWSGTPAETNHHSFYYNLSNSCGDKYPTSPPWDIDTATNDSLSDNHISYYNMNASSGTLLIDWEGCYNGTLNNMNDADWVGGKFDNSLDFDGINDEVQVSSVSALNPNHLTISAWIYPTGGSGFREIVAKRGTYPVGYWMTMRSSDEVGCSVDVSGAEEYAISTGTSVNLNTWSHVVCTYDGTNARIYINGTLAGTSSGTSGNIVTDSSDLYIGSKGGAEEFQGRIDEVAIWSDAKNQSQIAGLYNNHNGNNDFYTPSCGAGGGGGGGGVNVTKIANISDQNMTFLDRLYLNLSTYFQDWYELAIVFDEPIDGNESVLITGYGTAHADYFEAYLGTVGHYDNLTFDSYERNHTVQIDAFACDNQSDIDNFCPVAGFPSTCNVSAFYTDDHCVSSFFNLSINDTYTPQVSRNNNFSLYYSLDCNEQRTFPMWYYYQNYARVNITYMYNLTHNRTVVCDYGETSDTWYNDSISLRLQCVPSNIYAIFTGRGVYGNYSVTFNASNSNNSLTDTIVLISENDTSCVTSTEFEVPVNYTHFYDAFTWSTDETVNNWIMLFILLAVGTFFVLFVNIPLKFNAISMYVTFFALMGLILFFAIDDRIGWAWFIVPLVLFITYKVLGFTNG